MKKGVSYSSNSLNQSQSGENFLFVMGIDNYHCCTKLNNAVNDARVLIEVLTSDYHFIDDESHIFTLFNEEATRKSIYRQFRNLQKIITEDDNLIIFFSGHGHYENNFDGFWIPVEAKIDEIDEYIENTAIIKFIKYIKAKHILIIADSCFSGALFLETHRRVEGSRLDINKLRKLKSRWAFSSGRLEFVSDGISGQHSPFANYLIKYLRNAEENEFSTFDIVNYVRTATSRNSEQIPRGEPLKDVGDEGGEFIFQKRNYVDTEWMRVKVQNMIESYLNYLDKYPNTKYKEEIYEAIEQIEINEDEIWNEAVRKDKISNYLRYTSKFPYGRFVNEAKNRISDLKQFYLHPDKEKEKEIFIQTKPKSVEHEIKSYPKEAKVGQSRYDRFTEIARNGRKHDVEFLMKELLIDDGLGKSKLIDFALGLISNQEGVDRIKNYLFDGNKQQRNYAALYFKRRGYKDILERAVEEGAIDKQQAFSK